LGKQTFLLIDPGGGGSLIVAKIRGGNRPHALNGMIPVENLDTAGKTHENNRPNPGSAIIDTHHQFGFF